MLRLVGTPYYQDQPGLAPKAMFAMAILLLEFDGRATRQDLALMLYQGVSSFEALLNLRQLLFQITKWQKRSGIELIGVSPARVDAKPELYRTDVHTLLDKKVIGSDGDLNWLKDLWRGDLLANTPHDAETGTGSWVLEKQEAVVDHIADLLVSASQRLSSPLLVELLERILVKRPLDEDVFVRLIEAQANLGQNALAQRSVSRFEARLSAELGAGLSDQARFRIARALDLPLVTEIDSRTKTDGLNIAASGAVPVVMVMPPHSLSGASPNTIGLANALADDVVFHLCRQKSFAMLAPHSARKLSKGTEPPVVHADLDYLVRTSLVSEFDHATFRFQVVDLKSQQVLYADQIRFREDLLENERQLIARGIACAVSDNVADAELAGARSRLSPSSYVSFLKGSQLLTKTDLKSLRRARHHFEDAVRLRADYVPALAGIAHALAREWLILGRSDKDLAHRAAATAKRAVDTDPLHPDGLRQLGNAHLYLNAFDESAHYLDQAVLRAPHHADTLADAADLQVHLSNFLAADNLVSQALALNPFAPDDYLWIAGSTKFFLGDYKHALRMLLQISDQSLVHRLIAASAAMAGDMGLASDRRREWMKLYPDFRVAEYASFMPHKDKAVLERYVEALRRAGFR